MLVERQIDSAKDILRTILNAGPTRPANPGIDVNIIILHDQTAPY